MYIKQKMKIANLTKASITCLAAMIAVSAVFMTQSVFLEISDFFHVDINQARFAFSIVSIFYAFSFLLFGPAADRFELRKMSTIGLFFIAAGVFTAAIVNRFDYFIISMAIIGISASAVAASMFPYMVKIAPPKKQGLYLGAFVAASTAGMVIGRFLTGLMTSWWGHTNTLKIISMTIFIFSLLTMVVLNDKKINKGPKAIQKESKSYFKALKIIMSSEIVSLFMIGFFLFFGFIGMITFLSFRLTYSPFYFTSAEIGWISLAGLTAIPGSPLSGILAKKVGDLKVIIASLGLCLISVQLMGWVPLIVPIVTGLLLLFLGVYFCQPLVFLLISQKVPQIYLGTASSFYVLFCIGGGSVSSVLLGPIWKSFGWWSITLTCSCSMAIAMIICLNYYAFSKNKKTKSRVTNLPKEQFTKIPASSMDFGAK